MTGITCPHTSEVCKSLSACIHFGSCKQESIKRIVTHVSAVLQEETQSLLDGKEFISREEHEAALNDPFRLARHSRRLVEKLREENEELRELLNAIVGDLPASRDWLDPVIEARANDILQRRCT